MSAPYLTTDEVAEIWGTSKFKVLEAIRQGRLRAVKIGVTWKIKREWLDQYDEKYSNVNGFKAFALESVKVRTTRKKAEADKTESKEKPAFKKLQYIPPIGMS